MSILLLIDISLSILILIVAWFALTSPDLFRAVTLFIAFGLLVALVWVRLRAPDVALAEAAIGAGLTGALLLTTLSHMRRYDELKQSITTEETPDE